MKKRLVKNTGMGRRGPRIVLPNPKLDFYTQDDLAKEYRRLIFKQFMFITKVREDADCLTQSVFLKAFYSWDKIQQGNVTGFLVTLCANALSDHYNRERNRPSSDAKEMDLDDMALDSCYSDPARLYITKEASDRVLAAIRLIREKDKKAADMLMDQARGLTGNEIKVKYKIKSVGGVNEKICRTRKLLKSKCGDIDFLPVGEPQRGSGYISEPALPSNYLEQ